MPGRDGDIDPSNALSNVVSSSIVVVTVNVDGIGSYEASPEARMEAIADHVLSLNPDVLLFQEIMMVMYLVLRRRFPGWAVYRKHDVAEEYFVVTLVKDAAGAEDDRTSSYLFPTSNNGRHLLTVRRRGWALVNVHAESGGAERDERARQFLHMSRLHEHDQDRTYVLAGDFNAREGEDLCLLSEGWADAWVDARSVRDVEDLQEDDWTWRRGPSAMRFDRVYVHARGDETVECVSVTRVMDVWDTLTDHAALRVELRRRPYPPADAKPSIEIVTIPARSRAPEDDRPSRRRRGSPKVSAAKRQQKGMGVRLDVRVVEIANAVTQGLRSWRNFAGVCVDQTKGPGDAEVSGHVGMDIAWEDLPPGAFKASKLRGRGVRRRVTEAEREEQRRRYIGFLGWASACGLDEGDVRRCLESISARQQRSKFVSRTAAIPECMQLEGTDADDIELVGLDCRAAGLRKAASEAGRLLGGRIEAEIAAQEMTALFALRRDEYERRKAALPWKWQRNNGLCLHAVPWAGGGWIPGLFEAWLRERGALAMGGEAGLKLWKAIAQAAVGDRDHPIPSESGAYPEVFFLDGVTFDRGLDMFEHMDRSKILRGECPVLGAWQSFAWQCACAEVRDRYGDGYVWLQQPPQKWTMLNFYTQLHVVPKQADDIARRNEELKCLLISLRDVGAIEDAQLGRLRNHNQQHIVENLFDRQSIGAMWSALVIAQKHGGWFQWHWDDTPHPTAQATERPLPCKLQCEAIPIDQVEQLPDGVFKWGRYKTDPGVHSTLEDGWGELNERWQKDRSIRISVLKENEQRRSMAETWSASSASRPGRWYELRSAACKDVYSGRLREDGGKYSFQEDSTGFLAAVELPAEIGVREAKDWRDKQLYKALRARHARARGDATRAARREASTRDMPQTCGDMSVKGKTAEGKLVYSWQSGGGGKFEVFATPRQLRVSVGEDGSAWKRSCARETTPDRALRKMLEKVKKKSSKEQHQSIVARDPVRAASGAQAHGATGESMPSEGGRTVKELLDDASALAHVRASYEFLGSASLHHCSKCDEEWPVFHKPWPQSGVPWAGPKAGKCETIARAGFERAHSGKYWLCSRCDTSTSYNIMYSEENLQHLGPRHDALSTLTWYESLLIARVHPVMSVITLTATGLLCYAGHVCNYYVKVLEWISGLPAVLRDKKWFLIKRRRSIRSSATEKLQKKPTTANRRRLEAGIAEAKRRLPNVYGGSVDLPDELAKFPSDGEQEMLEQQESVDLTGEVHLSQQMFSAWMQLSAVSPLLHPCAVAIMRYAVDQQGLDLRGGVTGDTAWELCGRLLSLPDGPHHMSSRDLAQLLVYWLEEGQLPAQMREDLYEGMLPDLQARMKTIQTHDDEQAMMCRWLKLTIHRELDSAREAWAGSEGAVPVELEVEGGIVDAEHPSISAEAEQEATSVLQALMEQKSADRGQHFRNDETNAQLDEPNDWDEADLYGTTWHMSEDGGGSLGAEAAGEPVQNSSEVSGSADTDGLPASGSVSALPRPVVLDQLLTDGAHVGGTRTSPGHTRSQVGGLTEADYEARIADCVSRNDFETAAALQLALVGLRSTATSVPPADAAVQTVDGKPLVDPPEFGDRIKDTERQSGWIPGAFPTIFQNETGDPNNFVLKEVDLISWGPHVLRSHGWHAQAHMTFMYWWMNMIQRMQVLSAKKWYVRDHPDATGYSVRDLRNMNVATLAKQMVGYTANIPGTKASKSHLRKVILTMVRQIEIETSQVHTAAGEDGRPAVALGDVPCLFGTLTSQRYYWPEIIRIIAEVEGIEDYNSLSKGKRRELVNKYPLFVAWYCSIRLELVLKTVVVPIFGAHAYVAVYEWSPTGGMVHLHYILWKSKAPRFDLQADALIEKAMALRKAGLVAGGEVQCDVTHLVDFFADYISEWNPNKTKAGVDTTNHVAAHVNEAEQHTASLSVGEMLDLLRSENAHERFLYYSRAARTEQLHDFHYPDPLGPPNPSQPCARLLKGTLNMWYCGNGYPREMVHDPCDRSVAQDALRPDLWRVNLCRNCQLINPHMPLVTCALQSNTDATPVATKHQAEMYCCKYCSKHSKRKGQSSILYEVIDEMEKKDENANKKFGDGFEEAKLGSKLHRAFMSEVGEEMCQMEVAHHANRGPAYLCSRPEKHVHLYKKALAIDVKHKTTSRTRKVDGNDVNNDGAWLEQEGGADVDTENATGEVPQQKLGTKPSDIEVYERRSHYRFPPDTPTSPVLPWKETPEEQVACAFLWEFFRLVRLTGGRSPSLAWHPSDCLPIVIISPVVKLAEGPDFAFGARWGLMQDHPWDDRRKFLDMSDEEVKTYFRTWRSTSACPWFVNEQYLAENGRKARGGAGPVGARPKASGQADAEDEPEGGAGSAVDEGDDERCSESERESGPDVDADKEKTLDTHVLKMLYKGNVEEISREEQQLQKAKVFNRRHDFYRNTRCTSVAQEEQSALPAGVINVNEDSDDDEAYTGEQKEIAKEMEELRAVQHWVNQEGWDVSGESKALSTATSTEIDLRLDWGDVKKKLAKGADSGNPDCTETINPEVILRDYPLHALDPTQRAFADRVLRWVSEVVDVYEYVQATGEFRPVPCFRSWLGGSAGSGKSTTLKTIVQHARLLFHTRKVAAKIQLTAYTGVAAFNIGFGAKTACSAFQIFPKAAWHTELSGPAFQKLEQTWAEAILLIVDEVSFIGRAFFARMHFRMQQGRRRYFSENGLDPNEHIFGGVSIVLVGDFGQLEPIDDWSMVDMEATYNTCPKNRRHLWKHQCHGKKLHSSSVFTEAIMLSRIHRSEDDLWWTQSCLRLRDFTCTIEDDYDYWRQHDLDRGHLSSEQKKYFEDKAVWLCARCEDVGARNGRKLAHMAEDDKALVHQIHAQHSGNSRTLKKLASSSFDGLRPVVNLVRGCKIMLTRNVAYLYGLANGTRGTLIGAVYKPGAPVGTFPEALVVEIPDYCGPVFYGGEPKWVPLLPSTSMREGTRQTRTQFPIVAGFAMTVNKAQGLTIKEGVVIHLVGGKRFRPASKHGLPFVAFTRSESFAMTAFKNIPPWNDFVKGRDSDMLRMRLQFTAQLKQLHIRTLAAFTDMKCEADEAAAHDKWTAEQAALPRRRGKEGPRLPCAACAAGLS